MKGIRYALARTTVPAILGARPLLLALALVIVAALFGCRASQRPADQQLAPEQWAKISAKDAPTRGPADAAVTIVEYADFECPFCSRAAETMTRVLTAYNGKVKLIFKNFPLARIHPWAEQQAVAAACAFDQDPDAFWKLHDYFYSNQREFDASNVKSKAQVELRGTKVNLDTWSDCFDNEKTLDKIRADQAEGAAVGVTGTPHFIINGHVVTGAQPLDRFKAVIDDELSR